MSLASTDRFILFRGGIRKLDAAVRADGLHAIATLSCLLHVQQNPKSKGLAAQAGGHEGGKKAKLRKSTRATCDITYLQFFGP